MLNGGLGSASQAQKVPGCGTPSGIQQQGNTT